MLRVSIASWEPGGPRCYLNRAGWAVADDNRNIAVFRTISEARAVVAERRADRLRPTAGVRVEFDDPIMQACYDLGPPESKIT